MELHFDIHNLLKVLTNPVIPVLRTDFGHFWYAYMNQQLGIRKESPSQKINSKNHYSNSKIRFQTQNTRDKPFILTLL